MNTFRFPAISLLALLCGAAFLHAADPDDEYVRIYNLIQQADALAERGGSELARQKYSEAHSQLDRVRLAYPGWNPQVIQFRLNYVTEKLGLAKTADNPTRHESAEKTTPASAESADRIEQLLGQIRQLTADKELLQAKLKEALSAQPGAVDPRELARAEEKIKSLRKEVDVLTVNLKKAETRPDRPIDPAAFEQTKQGLAAANQKLTHQTEALASLTLERDALQRRLQTLADGTEFKAVREENESLKGRVSELQIDADDLRHRLSALRANAAAPQPRKSNLESPGTIPEARPPEQASRRPIELVANMRTLERELAEARRAAQTNADLVTVLQSAVRRAQDEKAALAEGKERAATPSANTQAPPLSVQLNLIDSLTREIAVLRARLGALEARAVPYSPEELALFRVPNSISANTIFNEDKKSSGNPVADTNKLIGEAQRAFAASHYDEAEKKYAQALRLDGKTVLIRANLAAAQIAQNHLAEGEANLKRALAGDSNNTRSLTLLGVVKVRQHKYDEALELLSQSAQLDPQNADTFQYLGVTLAEKGMRTPAESAFRRAIQLAPENSEAHHNLAIVYATHQPPALELARLHYQTGLAGGHPRDAKLEQLLNANKPATAVNASNR
jgi:tetratricopeptide (TPR) repeat protein